VSARPSSPPTARSSPGATSRTRRIRPAAALATAVAAGHRDFTHCVVVTEADEPTPPCGICRQALVEFAPRIAITSYTTSGAEASWSLADLLPHPFTPQSLPHK
jgi:cytidine deaminase